jgi:hypothetical protein
VWVAQADTIYPIPNTGYAAALIFRAAPDAPGPATFTLTSPSGGIVLGGADSRVTITVTGAQVELLLAAWPYGYALLRMTPPVGAPPTFPVDASIEIGAAQ